LAAQAHALFLEVDLSHFQQLGQPPPDGWSGWGTREGSVD
jgi:hypothetical protein